MSFADRTASPPSASCVRPVFLSRAPFFPLIVSFSELRAVLDPIHRHRNRYAVLNVGNGTRENAWQGGWLIRREKLFREIYFSFIFFSFFFFWFKWFKGFFSIIFDSVLILFKYPASIAGFFLRDVNLRELCIILKSSKMG